MKFEDNQKVVTLIDKGNVPEGSVGYIICVFDDPREAYEVEFWNDEDFGPYATETYLPSELKAFKELS